MVTARLDTRIVGTGRDLVLINALLSDCSAYEPLVERLADKRRLVLVDLPGFGASPAAVGTLDDFADLVGDVLDDIGIPSSADVLANGFGSFVSLKMAIRHGDRFERMVLVGSGIAFPEAGRATFRALADKVDADGMAVVAGAAVKRMFPDAFIAANPDIVAERERVFRSIDAGVFAASCRNLAAVDLAPDVGKTRTRTLVVIGEVDSATPAAMGRELARCLPDAMAVEMVGVGHCPHMQVPDRFVDTVAPFLGL